jgi:type III pantothenate kinase
MKVDVVVDVGNTRIKWGRCGEDRVLARVSLPPDGPRAWAAQATEWDLPIPLCWAVSGVHPERRDRFVEWLRQRGDMVIVLDNGDQLPISVKVEKPQAVGIDRLLDAVAARFLGGRADAIVVIDAGTAVTVDLLTSDGAFVGGAIFPGLRLMAGVLHEHTALLPLIDITHPNPALPGKDTAAAIRAGVYWAVVGGIKALIRQLLGQVDSRRGKVFITGGDAGLLLPVLDPSVEYWPTLTLEGIRIAAEALPG